MSERPGIKAQRGLVRVSSVVPVVLFLVDESHSEVQS